jgi:DNA-directed RNA polymerase specialized sigma24 family protein
MAPWGDDARTDRGTLWLMLLSDLTRRLARWWSTIDAAEIAEEAMVRGARVFGWEPVADRRQIWRWICTTSRRLAADGQRADQRIRFFCRDDLDAIAEREERSSAPATEHLAAALARAAVGLEGEVLRLLRESDATNEEMAVELGVSVRTVERTRQRLRHRALALQESARAMSVPNVY